MKKIFIAVLLVATVAMQAQTSRLMFGLGGGISTNLSKGDFKNTVCPMGTFNFGYTIMDSVGSGVMLGMRTGLNASYLRMGLNANIAETFTNIDYEGSPMDYTVKSDNVKYLQQQINLVFPVMFSVNAKGLYVNLGAKLMLPVWNKYEQTLENPTISVYYQDLGATILNDPSTGLITAEQTKMCGAVSIPRLFVGLSAEIGYAWQLSGENYLGFDLFVDYMPWSLGGSTDNNRQLIEVAPIVNDCEQPKANVTINPLTACNQFKYQYLNAGIKLVYLFDINH